MPVNNVCFWRKKANKMSKNKVKFQLLVGTALVGGLCFANNSMAQMPSLPSVEVHLGVLENLKNTKEFSIHPKVEENSEVEEVEIVKPNKISSAKSKNDNKKSKNSAESKSKKQSKKTAKKSSDKKSSDKKKLKESKANKKSKAKVSKVSRDKKPLEKKAQHIEKAPQVESRIEKPVNVPAHLEEKVVAPIAAPTPFIEKVPVVENKTEKLPEPKAPEKNIPNQVAVVSEKKEEKIAEQIDNTKVSEPKKQLELFEVEKNQPPVNEVKKEESALQPTNARPTKVVPLEFLPPVKKEEKVGMFSFLDNMFGSDDKEEKPEPKDVLVADSTPKADPKHEGKVEPAPKIKLKTTITQKLKTQPKGGVALPVDESAVLKKGIHDDLLKDTDSEDGNAVEPQPENPENLRGKSIPIFEADKENEEGNLVIPNSKEESEQRSLSFKEKEQEKPVEVKPEPRKVEVVPLEKLQPAKLVETIEKPKSSSKEPKKSSELAKKSASEDEEVESAYNEVLDNKKAPQKTDAKKTSEDEELEKAYEESHNNKAAKKEEVVDEEGEYVDEGIAESQPIEEKIPSAHEKMEVNKSEPEHKKAIAEPQIPDLAQVVEISPKQIDEVKPSLNATDEIADKKIIAPTTTVTRKTQVEPIESLAQPVEKKESMLSSMMKWLPSSNEKKVEAPVVPKVENLPAPTLEGKDVTTQPEPADPKQPIDIFKGSFEKVDEGADEVPAESVPSPEEQDAIAKAQLQIASINEEQQKAVKAAEKKVEEKVSRKSDLALSLDFKDAELDLSDSDREKLSDFVRSVLPGSGNVVIKSYAKGVNGEVNSARRISLKRAIEIRAHLISVGLDASRITVQAIGVEGSKSSKNSTDIYLAE